MCYYKLMSSFILSCYIARSQRTCCILSIDQTAYAYRVAAPYQATRRLPGSSSNNNYITARIEAATSLEAQRYRLAQGAPTTRTSLSSSSSSSSGSSNNRSELGRQARRRKAYICQQKGRTSQRYYIRGLPSSLGRQQQIILSQLVQTQFLQQLSIRQTRQYQTKRFQILLYNVFRYQTLSSSVKQAGQLLRRQTATRSSLQNRFTQARKLATIARQSQSQSLLSSPSCLANQAPFIARQARICYISQLSTLAIYLFLRSVRKEQLGVLLPVLLYSSAYLTGGRLDRLLLSGSKRGLSLPGSRGLGQRRREAIIQESLLTRQQSILASALTQNETQQKITVLPYQERRPVIAVIYQIQRLYNQLLKIQSTKVRSLLVQTIVRKRQTLAWTSRKNPQLLVGSAIQSSKLVREENRKGRGRIIGVVGREAGVVGREVGKEKESIYQFQNAYQHCLP